MGRRLLGLLISLHSSGSCRLAGCRTLTGSGMLSHILILFIFLIPVIVAFHFFYRALTRATRCALLSAMLSAITVAISPS